MIINRLFACSKKTFSNKAKIALISVQLIMLSACSAGKLFMAGYTPPQTIADLLKEQNELAGNVQGLSIEQLNEAALANSHKQKFAVTAPAGVITPEEGNFQNHPNTKITMQGYRKDSHDNVRALDTVDATTPYSMQSPIQHFRPNFTHKTLQDYAGQLAMGLIKNANGLQTNAAIGVTSFVKLDYTLQNTTILGNQMAEYSISEIQQFGLNVVDFKLLPAIEVTANGDLAFSRDVRRLANNKIVDHVLAATMIEKTQGIFINARIIALNTNKVVSTASVLVPSFIVQQTLPELITYNR